MRLKEVAEIIAYQTPPKKRSSSVFGCFGSICSVNKSSIKSNAENVKLKKCKSIDIPKPIKTEDTGAKKKRKKERNEWSNDKHTKYKEKSKKTQKEAKDFLEIPQNPEALPVIKGRKSNETFDISTKDKDLKVINLNSTFQKPEIVRKSRNSLQVMSKLA